MLQWSDLCVYLSFRLQNSVFLVEMMMMVLILTVFWIESVQQN